MAFQLALPGNRYLPHTRLLLHRLKASGVRYRNGEFTFTLHSCAVRAFVTKAKDTIALLHQAAVQAAIVPDEWLLEHLVSAPNSLHVLGPVPWLDVRLSVFGLPGTNWPSQSPHSVVTPFPNLVRKHFDELGAPVNQLFSVSGTTEVFIPAVADLGFDTIETGATLIAHGLVEIHTMHRNLGLSLVCRQETDPTWSESVSELLRQAYEARILDPA